MKVTGSSHLLSVVAGVMLLAITSQPAQAASITLTFEVFPGPDGILGSLDDVAAPNEFVSGLDTQFTSLGLTFTQGSLLQSDFGPFDGHGPLNHYMSSANPIGMFSIPVFGICIQSYSVWDATLTAFDANNLLASNVLIIPSNGESFLFFACLL